jgi:CubicO group peptidase (beta-lactamase class C family)
MRSRCLVLLLCLAGSGLYHPVCARAPDTIEEAALKQIFDGTGVSGTRAVIALKDGRLIAERYAAGYSARTRFISWSMAKSVTSTMIGILVDQGKLHLDAPAPIADWQRPGDPRRAITLRQMLHMSSGIQHQESAEETSPIEKADTTQMLFGRGAGDFVGAALAKPLENSPGSVYEYSTATSTLLAYVAGNIITAERNPAKRRAAISLWLKRNIFDPASMPSAVPEFDSQGNFLGGSLVHATARDWANFGQTYLNKGVGPAGTRVVSGNWVNFVQESTKTDAGYGGHFWLNKIRTNKSGKTVPALFPEAGPADAYAAVGHLGQFVIIVPSQKLVLVRLGKTQGENMVPVRKALGIAVKQLSAPSAGPSDSLRP